MDSLKVGIWSDFEVGCFLDNYVGTDISSNTVFGYNANDMEDENCLNLQTYGTRSTAVALTFLNTNLNYSIAETDFSSSGIPPIQTDPAAIWNNMNGVYKVGNDFIPMTTGGNGIDDSLSNPLTNFAFFGDAQDSTEWSMVSAGMEPSDYHMLAVSDQGTLQSGESVSVDLAYSIYLNDFLTNLEVIELMKQGVSDMQFVFDSGFEIGCDFVDICASDCIWPGDLNTDGMVNSLDLLAMGVAYNVEGPTRGTPLNWAPRNGENWPQDLVNAGNYKHIDATGGGRIDRKDGEMIEFHYGNQTTNYIPPVETIPAVGPQLKVELLGGASFNELQTGVTYIARVIVDSIPDLYGIKFDLAFDPEFFASITFNGENGFAGDDFNEVADFRWDHEDYVEYATIRTNTNRRLEDGVIGVFSFNIKQELAGSGSADETTLTFKNLYAVDNQGNYLDVAVTNPELFITNIVSTNTPVVQDLILYPNPTSDVLTVESKDSYLEEIKLLNSIGHEIFSFSFNQPIVELDIQSLTSGVYFLNIKTSKGTAAKKFLKK